MKHKYNLNFDWYHGAFTFVVSLLFHLARLIEMIMIFLKEKKKWSWLNILVSEKLHALVVIVFSSSLGCLRSLHECSTAIFFILSLIFLCYFVTYPSVLFREDRLSLTCPSSSRGCLGEDKYLFNIWICYNIFCIVLIKMGIFIMLISF